MITSFPTSCGPFLSPVSISPRVFLSFQHSYCSLFSPAVGGWWVFAVMIAGHVVSQLWVIRSNIISKAINGRQYSCVFYSFFHSSLNILTSLLFIHTGSSLITFREDVTGRDGGEYVTKAFLIKTKVSVLGSIFLWANMCFLCYFRPHLELECISQ